MSSSKQSTSSEYVEQLMNPILSRQERRLIYKEIHETLDAQLIMAVCYEDQSFAEYTRRFAYSIIDLTPFNVDLYILLQNEFYNFDIDGNDIYLEFIKKMKPVVNTLPAVLQDNVYIILTSKRRLDLLRELIQTHGNYQIKTFYKQLIYSAAIELDDVEYLTDVIKLTVGETTIVDELSKYRALNIKGQNILKHIIEHRDSDLYPAFKMSCAIASGNVNNIMKCPMYKTDYSLPDNNYSHVTYNIKCLEYMYENYIRIDYNHILDSITYDNVNASSLVKWIYNNIKVDDVVLSDDLLDMVDDDAIQLIYDKRHVLDLEMPRNDILHRRCKKLNLDTSRLFDNIDLNDLDTDIFDYIEYTKFLDSKGVNLLYMISFTCIISLDTLEYMLPKLKALPHNGPCDKLLTEYIQSNYITLIKCMLDAGIKLTGHHICFINMSSCIYLKKWIALKYPNQLTQ